MGDIRVVQVEYPQDWLAEPIEQTGQKQADWRTDPARTGAGGSTGDIGTHAFNLAGFVTGLQVEELAADLQRFVPGRRWMTTPMSCCAIRAGAGHAVVQPGGHRQRKRPAAAGFGTKAGIEWAQEDPNYLWVTPLGKPRTRITRAGAGAGPEAGRVSRIPPGHPEGYLEGFANIYAEAARAILARRDGSALDPAVTFPGLKEGVEGVAFVDACVRSSARNGAWVKLAI